jgi:MerR family transcriptional regulator, light-induced transcriptional regulator
LRCRPAGTHRGPQRAASRRGSLRSRALFLLWWRLRPRVYRSWTAAAGHAAIGQATAAAGRPEPSVFAGLRRRHPGLVPQVLRKATLLALTRAIEDECCARAEQPVLFAAFQQQRFFLQSQPRWDELARTARAVVVFAGFGEPAAAGGPPRGSAPVRVPLPADAPARREWTLVCDSRDYPACVAGWEFPGQPQAADASRRFEVI